jgi:hypothetical protein
MAALVDGAEALLAVAVLILPEATAVSAAATTDAADLALAVDSPLDRLWAAWSVMITGIMAALGTVPATMTIHIQTRATDDSG